MTCPIFFPPEVAETQQGPAVSEPESVPTEPPTTPPSNTFPSDSLDPASSEVTEAAAMMEEETPAAPTQGDKNIINSTRELLRDFSEK